MKHEPPSETYLIFQRAVTFLDEWLFYGLLLYLFVNGHYYMMPVVAALGGTFVWNSYKRQWAMESQRFGPLTPDCYSSDDERSPCRTQDDRCE